MIKILINNRQYNDFELIDPNTNKNLLIENYKYLDPIKLKLFSNDYLVVNDSKDEVNLQYSYIRSEAKLAGVLILENNKTYGRTNNGKRLLYRCVPDDSRLPEFLVPYDVKYSFNKKQTNKYVVFEFVSWNLKHPEGKLILTIGDVDLIENFFEYQLYCKSLNISINNFNKSMKNIMKSRNDKDIEDSIFNNSNYNIIDKSNEFVFSIDPEGSSDFDDALSIKINEDKTYIVTIYISNVYFWLESLSVWNSFSNRVATIYLPDYRRPMLPTILSEQFCSLQKGKTRFALATEFLVNNDGLVKVNKYYNCLIKVKNNFVYQEEKLLKLKDYNLLLSLANKQDNDVLTSSDMVAYWMKQTNTHMAAEMFKKKVGIFRSVKYIEKIKKEFQENMSSDTIRVLNNWNNVTGQYLNYGDNEGIQHEIMDLKSYIHITSPIRRIVDLLNQMIFLEKLDLIKNRSKDASIFLENWLDKMDYINNSVRSIRKIQSECNLLSICMNDPSILLNMHIGVVFDKIKKNDGTYNYMVYLEKLKMLCRYITPIEINNYCKKKFILYIFHNEDKFKKKIRLQIVDNQN
jgi:exoribonuclease R